MYSLLEVDTQAKAWRVDTIETTTTNISTLPAESRWQTVPLRDWGRSILSNQSVWYRLQFGVPSTDPQDWALFIDQAYSRTTIFINGSEIGADGPDLGVVPVLRNPAWFQLPRRLLQTSNELLIRTNSHIGFTTLDHLYVGPVGALRPAYQRSFDIKRRLRDATFFAMIAATAMFGFLAYLRRAEQLYWRVTLTIGSWTLCMLHRQFEQPPLVYYWWDAYGQVTLGWFALSAVLLSHSILGIRRVAIERVVVGWLVLGTVMMVTAASTPWAMQLNAFVWLPSLIVAGVYVLLLLTWQLAKRFNTDVLLYWVATCVLDGVAVHDYVTYFFVQGGGTVQLLSFTSLILMTVLGAIALRRFASALRNSEVLNRELEARVEAKAKELEANLGRLKDLERERALNGERERIMRDMHDGIGGHLVSALSIADRLRPFSEDDTDTQAKRAMRESIEACLQELRMIIDSSEPSGRDLPSVLGMLRLRASRRLSAAGVHFNWQVSDVPPLKDFDGHKVLQVMRIVQEALTNVVKHAGATEVGVRTEVKDNDVSLEISDNGRGISTNGQDEGRLTPTGRGLLNMKRRAEDIGARLTVSSDERGTTVRLNLPRAETATG